MDLRLRSQLFGWAGPSFLCLVLIGAGLGGCASSRTGEQVEERLRVLGTWEYRTTGIGALQRGTLQIVTRDGDLVGRFRDQWRGQFEARIRLQGTRMVIAFDQLRIQGRIRDGRFSGVVREPEWDVTQQAARPRSPARFEARRVRAGSGNDGRERFGCPSLLRESSYACSPLRPR